MNLKWYLSCLLLVVSPFLATAQDLSGTDETLQKAEIALKEAKIAQQKAQIALDQGQLIQKQNTKLNIQFSKDWQKRLKAAAKKSGGGAIDGGGGNVDAKTNELLELSLSRGVTSLDIAPIKTLLETNYASRLQTLENDLPGFKEWFLQAFETEMIWSLDSKKFDDSICKNSQFNQLNQKVVACQSIRRVNLQTSWYQNPKTTTQNKLDIIIHELVRYHVIRLAREINLARDAQDDIVGRVTQAILDANTTGDALYDLLVKEGLWMNPEQLETTRLNELTEVELLMASTLNNFNSMFDLCQKPEYATQTKDLIQRSISLLQRQVARCQWLSIGHDSDFETCSVDSTRFQKKMAEKCLP